MKMPFFYIITVLAALANANDEWMTSGKDDAFPQEKYFVGIGQSDRTQDAAKQNALVEVQKQISVSISATVRDEKNYSTVNGKENSSNRFESRAQVSTTGEVQGIEVVRTGKQGKNYYALAVLDKKNFASNCRTDIAESRTGLIALVKEAGIDIDSLQIGAALIKLSAADKLILKIIDLRKLLSAAEALTDVESVPCSPSDMAQLYDKCISSLKMARTSGDGQSGDVGSIAEPFVVTVTAGETPVAGITVNLLDAANKIVGTGYTDDNGTASFAQEAIADLPVGKYSYTAAIAVAVSQELDKKLNALNQMFSYTVTSTPCFVKLVVRTSDNLSSDKNEIIGKIKESLSIFDIKDAQKSDRALMVNVSAVESGKEERKKGVPVNTDVTITMSLKDDEGREAGSSSASGAGRGQSMVASAIDGIATMSLGKKLRPLLEILRSSDSSASHQLRIAVFEFKARGAASADWPDLSKSLSEMIVTRLINTGKVAIVERSQLNLLTGERSMEEGGLVEESEEEPVPQNTDIDEKEALQAAKLAGADLVLLGSAGVKSDKIEVDARIVEMKSGIARCSMSSGSYSTSDLRALADDLVGQIRGKCLKSR